MSIGLFAPPCNFEFILVLVIFECMCAIKLFILTYHYLSIPWHEKICVPSAASHISFLYTWYVIGTVYRLVTWILFSSNYCAMLKYLPLITQHMTNPWNDFREDLEVHWKEMTGPGPSKVLFFQKPCSNVDGFKSMKICPKFANIQVNSLILSVKGGRILDPLTGSHQPLTFPQVISGFWAEKNGSTCHLHFKTAFEKK